MRVMIGYCLIIIIILEKKEFEQGGMVRIAEVTESVFRNDNPWFIGSYGILISTPKTISFQPYLGRLGFLEFIN